MERKLCTWIAARRNKWVIVTKKMCLALAGQCDTASDTEIAWAKSARGMVYNVPPAHPYSRRSMYSAAPNAVLWTVLNSFDV